VTDGFGTAAL